MWKYYSAKLVWLINERINKEAVVDECQKILKILTAKNDLKIRAILKYI